jgi:type II secretory pathway component GspD/PulD (secretin)
MKRSVSLQPLPVPPKRRDNMPRLDSIQNVAKWMQTSIMRCALWGSACIGMLACASPTTAQEMIQRVGPDGTVMMVPADGSAPTAATPGGQPPGTDGKPATPAEPGKGDKPKEPDTTTVKRPRDPPEPPNKREFDVRPDEDGMIQFQFRNQGWPEIMQWLAEVSVLSLDWQELPADFLSIATQGKTSLEQTRDIINRHLLARGFTILEFPGMIQVVKTAGINSALVPRVNPEQLESLQPNRFVRVTFSLQSLIATELVAELKSMTSSNGTLNALSNTNRLEAMDTAANLAQLHRILSEEQSEGVLNNLAREFVLEHVRASDAREQLMSFMKLESPKGSSAMPEDPMMQQQMMMMQQQMAMQQAQMGNAGQEKKKSEIYLVANQRRNSLIAHAPPNKMAIIAAFVKRIDIASSSDAMQALSTRMKVYRLASLDPKKVVSSLMAMDVLEPTSRLEIDEKNKAIIAHASMADHYAIQETLKRLDGSAREFDVIQLRKLRAEDVAGTIRSLMGTDKDKKDDSSRRRSMYYWDPFGSNKKDDGNDDQLRVGANSQNNQLLIWANELEREDINKLLIKLGELPPEGGNRSRVRVIDANRSAETREYLERLKKNWERVSPNPLQIPEAQDFDRPSDDPANADTQPKRESDPDIAPKRNRPSEPAAKPKDDPALGLAPSPFPPPGRLSSTNLESANPAPISQPPQSSEPQTSTPGSPEPDDSIPADAVPPSTPTIQNPNRNANPSAPQPTPAIEILFDERGNLVIKSDDTEALDRLEQMMTEDAPPSRSYHVFRIRHSRPSWVRLNLEDYFKDDSKKNNNDDAVFRWIFDMDAPKKEEGPELGKKRKLKFISDSDTNTLVVVGADEVQLGTIEQLIKLWDVPKAEDKQSLRYTKIVKVQYSKAQSITEAMKEAFRDLLSSNDKALEKKPPEGAGGSESKRDSSGSVTDGGMSFDFSGRLSLGIDRITNSIIVSAKGEDLLDLVLEMIEELDQNARPSEAIEVAQMNGTSTKAMEKALRTLLQRQPQPNDPNAQPGQANQQGQQGGRQMGNGGQGQNNQIQEGNGGFSPE